MGSATPASSGGRPQEHIDLAVQNSEAHPTLDFCQAPSWARHGRPWPEKEVAHGNIESRLPGMP
jgi:hypothetical protein